jgi:hypothetical protein
MPFSRRKDQLRSESKDGMTLDARMEHEGDQFGVAEGFLGFVAVGGVLLYQSNARAKAQVGQMTKVEAVEPGASVTSINRIAARVRHVRAYPARIRAGGPRHQTENHKPKRGMRIR